MLGTPRISYVVLQGVENVGRNQGNIGKSSRRTTGINRHSRVTSCTRAKKVKCIRPSNDHFEVVQVQTHQMLQRARGVVVMYWGVRAISFGKGKLVVFNVLSLLQIFLKVPSKWVRGFHQRHSHLGRRGTGWGNG